MLRNQLFEISKVKKLFEKVEFSTVRHVHNLFTVDKCSLQIDEITYINKKAQLLTVVRFLDVDFITDKYLFCNRIL